MCPCGLYADVPLGLYAADGVRSRSEPGEAGYFRHMGSNDWQVATREMLDQGRAYQAYCLLGGDAGKTAVMMHTSPEVIESLAHDFQWGKSVRADISTDEKIEAFQKLNRMSQYMVAERAREIVSSLVERLHADPKQLESMCMKVSPDGETLHFDPKSVETLAKTLSTIGEITYRALGDAEAVKAGQGNGAKVGDVLDLYARMQARFESKTTAFITTAEAIKNVTPVDAGPAAPLRGA